MAVGREDLNSSDNIRVVDISYNLDFSGEIYDIVFIFEPSM